MIHAQYDTQSRRFKVANKTSRKAVPARNPKKTAGAAHHKNHASQWTGSRPEMSLGKFILMSAAVLALIALAFVIGNGKTDGAASCPLQISEVMVSNTTTLFLADGSAPDWIEIRNGSDKSVDLAGYGLVAETAPTDIFTFPTRSLEPGAYLLVYADGNVPAGSDHAPFRLSSGGGKLALLDKNGTGADIAEIPALENDQSFARNGDGSWDITDAPTPGEGNNVIRHEEAQPGETVLQLREGELEITEVMTGNATWFADENGRYQDYIEIHNRSNADVNLAGWYLTDNIHKLARWQFPDMNLPAGAYLAVHCSGENRTGDASHLHTSFRLAAEGDTVVLTAPDGVSVDMVQPPLLETDQAYSRTDTGWTSMKSPTPGAANTRQASAAIADELRTRNAGGVYISEISATSAETDDWIEIHNGGSQAVDLSGWGLSDNAGRPRKWQFPTGTTINPGQYMGILCDGLDNNSGGCLHTNFALSSAGGYSLTLSDPQGAILDRMFVDAQYSGVSYGRAADRSGARYFDKATPGAANSSASYSGRASAPEYSVRGGLFKSGDQISVSLTAQPGERIYYTLDCSDPTQNSTLYTGPISISKTTVLRTRVYADDCMPSLMDSCTYLFDAKNGGGSVYVLSLVSDPYNLTSAEAGILVKGNYNNYMKDWEREAHVEVFDREGKLILSQECAVRQQGQTSRDQPQQSLKLIARSQYGSNVFKGKIFTAREDDWCTSFIMRTANDDQYGTRMRDSVLTSLANSTDDLLYQETEVCVAYINGQYWGHYNLRETANTDFICQLEGWVGQEDTIDYVRGNKTLMQGSDETYQSLLQWVKGNKTNTDAAYEHISSVIDVKNYIEYLVIEMYVGNTDPSDIKRYRNASADGLWRWVLFDLDWAYHTDANSISAWLTPGGTGYRGQTDNTLFVACMNNPTFRDQFLTHFGEQLATTFAPESILARFEERYNVLKTILPDHRERWGGSQEKYEKQLSKVVSYAKRRPARMLQYFKYDNTLRLSQADYEKYFGEAMKVLNVTYDQISRP